jgi:hypothetical protein
MEILDCLQKIVKTLASDPSILSAARSECQTNYQDLKSTTRHIWASEEKTLEIAA